MESEKTVMTDEKSRPVYDGKGGVTESASDAEVGSGQQGHVEVIETTKRGLKARHAQMIALGGTIGKYFNVQGPNICFNNFTGTGLFVGSGGTLARGGPLFILIAYSTIALLVLFIVTAIVEVAAYLPIS